MAFVLVDNLVVSFANSDDVKEADQRIFDENEGLSEYLIDTSLEKSTTRILVQLKASEWWSRLAFAHGSSALTIPDVNPNYIKARQADFTDLAVYHALFNYILPTVADFSNEENAERVKIEFYRSKYNDLLAELLLDSSWYDYNNDGNITEDEVNPFITQYKRVR